MLPGSICSGSHSVTMFSSATMVTSVCSPVPNWRAPARAAKLSRAPAFACAARRLLLRGAPVEDFRPDLAHGVTQAHAQQGLARVLEHVDHLTLRVLQVNALAIGQEVVLGAVADRFGQPPSQLLLQELHDAAYPLQRKALAPEGADHRDLSDILKRIEPSPAFPLRLHDAAFVPPLELPRRNACKLHHLRRCKTLVHLL